jgi:hypothetical protein
LKALKSVIDGTIEALSDEIETLLFRSGSGSICQLHATTVPTVANPMVLTLDYPDSITGFEVGMVIVASTADGGATRNTPATATIAAVNRTLGTITTGYDNGGAGTNWATTDYISRSGNEAAAGTNKCISGLAQWFPASGVTPGALFGVTRTTDSRLYGLSYDGSSGPIEENLIVAQSRAARERGKPDICIMHHAQYRRLILELGAKKVYSEVLAKNNKGGDATVGYSGVQIIGDHVTINVVAANKCQPKTAWMLTKDCNLLASLGSPTSIIIDDGLRMLRSASADSYEIRTRFRGNFASKAPIWNVNITMPDPA